MWKLYRKIRSILNGLLLMEVMLGAVIIAVAATYHSKLSSFMTQAERTMISTKLAHAYILGFQLIALYLGSLIMWKRIWLRRYSQSIQLLLKVWLFFCSLLAICSCATMWSLLEGEKVVGESVEMLLQRGIDAYYTNPEWKFLWDQLQYKQECCGVNGYMDWMRAAWMPRSTSTTTSIPKDYQYFDYETELNEETQYPHTIMEKKSANRAATELPKAPLDRGFTQG
uniref:Tetraspanin n=1 Tax=Stomoxys calcitrans TaxID=35570 RepID=A0A1I8NUQ0_STOCA